MKTPCRLPSLTLLLLAASAAPVEVKEFKTIIPPDGQCYHGTAISMYDSFEKDVKEFQEVTGKKVAVLHWFTPALNKDGKPCDWAGQQRKFMERCKNLGCIPCINYSFKSDEGKFAGFDAYTSGKMDKQLKGMAGLFLEYGGPVLLAINHEMNGNWYPWSAARKHSSEKAAIAEKEDAAFSTSLSKAAADAVFKGYIESWRYIHHCLRSAGCRNVAFCFVISAGATVDAKKNPYPYIKYYPGDEYVDWLGFDTYNNTPPEALEKLATELEALAKGRPLMIKEWGTCAKRAQQYLAGKANYPGDGKWANAVFDVIEKHPAIKAISYFHRGDSYKITRKGGEAALGAYKERIANNRYLPRSVARE